MNRKVTFLLLVPLMVLGAIASVDAANYYVSPSGIASWSGCTNIATPCTATTAFANARAGDTVYFRGGTYNQTAIYGDGSTYPKTPYSPAHSGTSSAWITFQAYPGETPIINGYVPLTPDRTNFALPEAPGAVYPANQSHCIAVWSQSYIILDGFTIQANGGNQLGVGKIAVAADNSGVRPTYVILRNMTFSGGSLLPQLVSTTSYDNTECVRIESTDHITVTNCRFNGPRIAFGTDGGENHNVSSLKLYDTNFVTMEHLDITNSTNGVYIKSKHNNDTTVQNSFIHDGYLGILVSLVVSNDYDSSDRGTIVQNVFANLAYQAFSAADPTAGVHGNDWVLAQNTFVKTWRPFLISNGDAGHGWTVYNNLASGTTQEQVLNWYSGSTTMAAIDHNQWGTGSHTWSSAYTTLAQWQASSVLDGGGSPGVGDLESDPQFVNGSGTLMQLADFALSSNSPCKGAGRNGANMGANITSVGYHDPVGSPMSPQGRPIIKHP